MKVLIVNRFFGGAQIPTGRMASGFVAVKGKKVGTWLRQGAKVEKSKRRKDS